MIVPRARFAPRSAWLVRVTAAMMLVSLVLCPSINRVIRVQRIDKPSTQNLNFQRSLNIPPQVERHVRDLRIVPFIVVAVPDARPVMLGRPDEDVRASIEPLADPRSLRAPPTVI